MYVGILCSGQGVIFSLGDQLLGTMSRCPINTMCTKNDYLLLDKHSLPVGSQGGPCMNLTYLAWLGLFTPLRNFIQKGLSLVTAVWRGGFLFSPARRSPLRPPPTAGWGARKKFLTWPPVKWACQEPLEIKGGTNAGERKRGREREEHVPRNQPWNATWHRSDRACRDPQQTSACRTTGREEWVYRGLMGARSFYLTGCFINVIKHGRALWLCIIADLHSWGRREMEEEEGE